MPGKGLHTPGGEAVQHLRIAQAGQQQLSLGGGVEGLAGAGILADLQAGAGRGYTLVKNDALAAIQQRDEGTGAGLLRQLHQMGMGHGGDIPLRGHGAAAFKQTYAQIIFSVIPLLHHAVIAQRGQNGVDGTFRNSGTGAQLLQTHGSALAQQQFDDLHGLADGFHLTAGMNGRCQMIASCVLVDYTRTQKTTSSFRQLFDKKTAVYPGRK